MTQWIQDKVTLHIKLKTKLVELQPGDGTRYSFTIGRDEYISPYLRIAGTGEGAEFKGYLFDEESINQHFLDCSEWYDDPAIAVKGAYQVVVRYLLGRINQEAHYIEYIVEHTQCNPWTAVAAMLAAKFALESWDV